MKCERVVTCPVPVTLSLTACLAGAAPLGCLHYPLELSPLSYCPFGPAGVWPWGPGSSIRLAPVSPRGGQTREGTLWRRRPGLGSDQSRALVCGGREAGRADGVSGQTWESTHGPFSKAGAVPGAPAGSSGLFHWAHPSLAWPMVEMQI